MILYHGTNADFDAIDLCQCAPFKDFGTGFYTTTLFEQAEAMAKRKSRIFGGSPVVLSFEAPNDLLSLKNIRVLDFSTTSKDWAIFIMNNRNRDFLDISSPLCNLDCKYDIVHGPVANDTLTTLISRYKRGFIDVNVLLKEMQYSAPSDQYSFHSPVAIALLEKVDTQWI